MGPAREREVGWSLVHRDKPKRHKGARDSSGHHRRQTACIDERDASEFRPRMDVTATRTCWLRSRSAIFTVKELVLGRNGLDGVPEAPSTGGQESLEPSFNGKASSTGGTSLSVVGV